MIEITNLTKSYGDKKALKGISMHIEKGEVVGFLGPNGAGKSTTMNIITGFISYTSGSVKIDGIDILENPKAAKQKIGYLPEIPPLYTDMTVEEYLDFVYDLKKAHADSKENHIKKICASTGIGNVYKRKIGNLSKGYRQRTGLASALIGDPDILILDEPTVGLDPQQIIEIRDLIKELGKTKTVILSSHILSEVQAVCERVIIINNGSIIAEGTPEELSEKLTSHKTVSLSVVTDKPAEEIFASVEGVARAVTTGTGNYGSVNIDIITEQKINVDILTQINKIAAENGMVIVSMKEDSSSLEDVFIKLTHTPAKRRMPRPQKPANQQKQEAPKPEKTDNSLKTQQNIGESTEEAKEEENK